MPAIFRVDFVPVDAELVHMPVVTIFRRTPIEAVWCWDRRNRFEAQGRYPPLPATCPSKRRAVFHHDAPTLSMISEASAIRRAIDARRPLYGVFVSGLVERGDNGANAFAAERRFGLAGQIAPTDVATLGRCRLSAGVEQLLKRTSRRGLRDGHVVFFAVVGDELDLIAVAFSRSAMKSSRLHGSMRPGLSALRRVDRDRRDPSSRWSCRDCPRFA